MTGVKRRLLLGHDGFGSFVFVWMRDDNAFCIACIFCTITRDV